MRSHDVVWQTGASQSREPEELGARSTGMVEHSDGPVLANEQTHGDRRRSRGGGFLGFSSEKTS